MRSINGTQLHIEESGSGAPLLFVHGTGGGTFLFERVVRELPDYRCIRYDRRGNAQSAPADVANTGIEGDADDLAALIEALDVVPVNLVGLSWGSAIVIDVLRRYPSLCSRAVLGEPTIFALDPNGAQEILALLQPRIGAAMQTGGPREAVDAFYATACGSFWETLSEQEREPYRANAHGMFRDLQAPPYAMTPDDLRSIATPCAVLVGEHTSAFHAAVGRVVEQNLPNAEYFPIANSGHVVFGEQPAVCAQIMRGFLLVNGS